jgi:site-specific DNA-methyltransferase (adenine-specific)
MNIENLRIADLTPDPQNARKHDQKNLKAIEGSLKEFGQRKPIVITGANVIVAGNGTVAAAKNLGWETIEAVRVPADWTKDQVKAFALADNRTAELATWSPEVLAAQLIELESAGFEIAEFGFDKIEPLINPDSLVEDEVPDLPADPVTKLGDVWKLGKHRLMCGDSTDLQSAEKLMCGDKADLLHTDPPYNVDYDNSTRPNPGKSLGKIQNDVMDDNSFYLLLESAFTVAYSLLKDNASAYIWHSDREIINFKQAATTSGFKFAQSVIWKKPMLLSRTRYQWAHEPCLFLVKGSPYFTPDRKKTTVWDFGGYDKSKNLHPTQKPLFIPTEAIQNSSQVGDLVLDLFGGSGSTLLACEQTNRMCYMMELDPKYCDVIIKRWENLTGLKAELVNATR